MLRINDSEIFILAGGLSTRMGRDKARLPLGSRTMLQHIRAIAKETGLRVRVIRRDAVARCGPLGGIYTGLKRSRAEKVMFLACDMPFVTTALIRRIVKRGESASLFATEGNQVGFPCLLMRETALPVVLEQINTGEHSIRSLAKKLRAKTVRGSARELANINTPEELERASRRLRTEV